MAVSSVAMTELTGLVGAAYTDIDLDSFVTVPAGATGCIILVNNPSATNYSSDVRTNGSTDSHAVTHNAGDWFAYAVKLAADNIVEIYVGNTAMKAYVRDFFGSESVFFTNSVLKSLASGSWLDVNIATDTGADTAIGAYIKLHSVGGSRLAGLRKNGSTDNRVLTCDNALGIVGVDASEIFECQTNDTDMDPYLVGYCTTGAAFDTNATDKSIATTGAYADADTLDSGKSHGVYEFANSASGVPSWLRKKGATDDLYYDPCFQHCWNVIAGDASRVVEGKISATTADWFRIGQFDAASSGVTGTIAVTLASFTSAISGTTAIQGSMAETLANFTSTISGTTAIQGTMAASMEDFTSSISGSTGISGTMAAAIAAFTSAISATTTIIGTMAQIMSAFVSSIFGTAGSGTVTSTRLPMTGVGS